MEENTFHQGTPAAKPQKRSKKLFFYLIVIIVVLVIIFTGWRLLGSKSQKKLNVKITPTPTEFSIPTDTPTPTNNPSVSPTPKLTSAPTSKPTSNPIDKTTGLDRSKLTVSVENGSGEAGVAGKAASFLKNLGYDVTATGNADNYNYTGVTIQVRNNNSDYLPLLKKDLSSSYTVNSASSDLSASSSADALVIIGK